MVTCVKGWPKGITGGTLFVCPYCSSRDGVVRFIPVKSRELVYAWEHDLGFHKPCGNHLALRVMWMDKAKDTFTVVGHIVPNLFATLDCFDKECADRILFLKTYRKFGRGMELVVERAKEFTEALLKHEGST